VGVPVLVPTLGVPVLPSRSKLGGHLLDGGGQLEVEVDERIEGCICGCAGYSCAEKGMCELLITLHIYVVTSLSCLNECSV
jgi:hypothetical protein